MSILSNCIFRCFVAVFPPHPPPPSHLRRASTHHLMGSFNSRNSNLKQMTFTADDSDSELYKSQNGVRRVSLSLSLSLSVSRHGSLSQSLFLYPPTIFWSQVLFNISLPSPIVVNHIGIKSQTLCVYFIIKSWHVLNRVLTRYFLSLSRFRRLLFRSGFLFDFDRNWEK